MMILHIDFESALELLDPDDFMLADGEIVCADSGMGVVTIVD